MPSSTLDSLYRRVAKKVLIETLGVKNGQAVTVEAWNNGVDFARHVVAESRTMGCTAIMVLEDESAYVEGVRNAPKEVLGLMGKNEYSLLADTDAYVFIPGQAIGAYSKTLTAAERDESTRYNDSWYDAAKKARLRGARLSFGYVGKDLARMVGKSVPDVVKGQLQAALTDFKAISASGSAVASQMTEGAEVTVGSGNSSLSFTLKGELEVQDGIVGDSDVEQGNNMAYVPPGVVTKDVDPASVEGSLHLSPTLTKYGVLSGAELEFKGGRLVEWKTQDRALLKKLLDPISEEKRSITFVGVGLNPAMKYGLGQDRFVAGGVTLGGLGFNALVKNASFSAGGSTLVSRGSLAS